MTTTPTVSWEQLFDKEFVRTEVGVGRHLRKVQPSEIKSFIRTKKAEWEAAARQEILISIFALEMSDPYGYGNAKVEVSDLEKLAASHGLTKDRIISQLTARHADLNK